MKKPHLLTIGFLFFACSLTAQSIEQQLIGVAGENDSGNHVLLDWTLGETFTTFNNAAFGSYKEGFLQPIDLSHEKNEINIETDYAFSDPLSVEIFPNPFIGTFSLLVNKPQKEDLHFVISDYSGKNLVENTLAAGSLKMECAMNEYPSGLYFLQFVDDSGALRHSFKLLKL